MASTPWIYAALDDWQVDHQDTMVKIEGKVSNTSISILIDLGAYQRYVSPKVVDICKLNKDKHEKPWLVQLAMGTKWKVSKIFRDCEVNLNGFLAKLDLNILPLG